jgi:hypothetical protein
MLCKISRVKVITQLSELPTGILYHVKRQKHLGRILPIGGRFSIVIILYYRLLASKII